MELTLLTHENRIGDEITKSLRSGKYSDFKIAVAYSKNSGIGRIYNDLTEFANNGGKTSVIAGIDQANTSYQALINLKTFAKENLYIHHDKNIDITFHPKVYLFGNQAIEKVIIGSSNLTKGGLYENYEANICLQLDSNEESKEFKNSLSKYWTSLLEDVNTFKSDLAFIKKLLEQGKIVDERKQRPFKEIIEKFPTDLPFKAKKKLKTVPPIAVAAAVVIPQLKVNFAMSLSGFDVSAKSQDPVILIPITALKAMPVFWNFPMLYTDSGAGYPQLYATANIRIDGKLMRDQHIRIYYYDKKKEFRLQCEPIKRSGKQGDIITINKDPNKPLEFEIELLRTNSAKFKVIEPILKNKVSPQKYFTYY